MNETIFDKKQLRRSFERAAGSYDDHAVLQREICARLLERLDYIRIEPQRVLDIGSGTGFGVSGLRQRYPKAELHAIDIAHDMSRATARLSRWRRKVRCVTGDVESLPYADNSFDLLFSNMTLQWCNDVAATMRELMRVLRPGGMLLFTTFGPDTLKELRASWASVDDRPHVSPFIDMHDVGDMMIQARFADPVMDMEQVTMTYRDVRELMKDLKGIGAHNVQRSRAKGLTTPAGLQQMTEAYENWRQDGVLPASYEVVYGHAWKSEAADGSVEVVLK